MVPRNSARQHKSTTEVGKRDNNSTPGRGRWASHGGGDASNVDAPGSNSELYSERASKLALEGIILISLKL